MNIQFGISFTLPEHFSKIGGKLPDGFQILEIPGDLLDSNAHIAKLKALRKQKIQLCARDLIAPEIAGLIPDENCKLRAELEQHFAGRCAAAAEAGIVNLTNVFDLAGTAGNQESRNRLSIFLKRCAGVIRRHKQILRLQLRIPAGNGTPDWHDFYQLRRDLLCPGIDWTLELHPHEPGAQEQLEQILPLFCGCDRFRRVCYNAESGNKLTCTALKYCSRTLPGPLEPLTLLLSPGDSLIDEETAENVKNFNAE